MKKIKSVSKETLTIINRKNIKPIPKWEFVFKKWILWVFFIISVLFGGLAISLTIYMNNSNDFDLYYFPLFWLLILGVFLALAYFSFKKTNKGYRYNLLKILIFELIFSLVLGVILTNFQVGKRVDSRLARNIPIYREVAPMKIQIWMNPESGYLAGEIISVRSDKKLELKDFNNLFWIIEVDNSKIKSNFELRPGTQIKLIGNKLNSNTFRAEEIRPWGGPGQIIERKKLKLLY